VGLVAGAAYWGYPYWGYSSWAYWGYNCPAGYTPVTPPNTLPSNVTGVGYCQAVAPVVYTVPAVTVPTTRVVVLQPGQRVVYVKATRRVGPAPR